jgi:hypothetical protein
MTRDNPGEYSGVPAEAVHTGSSGLNEAENWTRLPQLYTFGTQLLAAFLTLP